MNTSMIFLVIMVAAAAVASSQETTENKKEGANTVTQNLKKLKDLVMEKIRGSKKEEIKPNERKQKSLNYYSYYSRPLSAVDLDYQNLQNLGYYFPQNKNFASGGMYGDEWLSRTEPFKRKNTQQQQQLLDSPVYYIRLPPNPYVFVPGVGYISRPPSLNEPEVLNSIENGPEKLPEQDIVPSNFIHVPIDFVSNGKPTSVYQLPNDPIKGKPGSNLMNLNKGPYLFNGKPTDIYILRNSYNSMYQDALTHFYP